MQTVVLLIDLTFISEALALAGMICLTVAMLVYWLIKSHKVEDIITNSIENVIRDATEDVELQKKIYQLGGLIGNGVKSGIGIQTRGGKFKIEDLLMGLASKFLGGSQEEGSNNSGHVL